MSAKEYQNEMYHRLSNDIFPEVHSEWNAFKGFKKSYLPRVDIAIGPYSVTPGNTLEEEYDRIVESTPVYSFLRCLNSFHNRNIDQYFDGSEQDIEMGRPSFDNVIHKNRNARCLLAIEIENKNSKKHIMGSMVNAASLGRIGIGIAYNAVVLNDFIRIINYLAFLTRVEKNSYDTSNLIVVSRDQFETAVSNIQYL